MLSPSAWSESALCPGQREVLLPVAGGKADFYHPLSRAARSVCHLLSGSTPKNVFENISIQKLHKSKMFQCCPGRRRAMDTRCPGQHRVLPPVVQGNQSDTTCCPGRRRVLPLVVLGDAECYHPLSGATGSVTTVVQGGADI